MEREEGGGTGDSAFKRIPAVPSYLFRLPFMTWRKGEHVFPTGFPVSAQPAWKTVMAVETLVNPLQLYYKRMGQRPAAVNIIYGQLDLWVQVWPHRCKMQAWSISSVCSSVIT